MTVRRYFIDVLIGIVWLGAIANFVAVFIPPFWSWPTLINLAVGGFLVMQARSMKRATEDSPLTPDIVRAHRHARHHRDEILASDRCGCFYCLAVFPPSSIVKWIDGDGQTALCPHCGIDSVIGSESGYPVTSEFLSAMSAHWFEPSKPKEHP